LGFHNRIEAMPSPRSFPRPWSVIEIPGGYRVDDASGQRLGYFYSWDDPTARYHADVLTADEARRIAENFAKLPELQQLSPAPTELPPAGFDLSADQDGGEEDNPE
jgi:hypothetical protein